LLMMVLPRCWSLPNDRVGPRTHSWRLGVGRRAARMLGGDACATGPSAPTL